MGNKLITNDLPNIIAVDFDGVLCEEKWPSIGEPNEDAIEYILDRQKNGSKLILWTNRVGERLDEAIAWCEERGIIFDAINDNLPEAIEKYGSNPRKVFAHEYLDDRMSVNHGFQLPFTTEKVFFLEAAVEFENGTSVKRRTYTFSDTDICDVKAKFINAVVADGEKILPDGGQAHVTIVLTQNGEYVDSDEDWIDVAPVRKENDE